MSCSRNLALPIEGLFGGGSGLNNYPLDFGLRSCECREDHARIEIWPEPVPELAFVRESSEEMGCEPDGAAFVHVLCLISNPANFVARDM